MPTNEIVTMLKAAGFQVWMRKPTDEHCYCTDGTHIAYVQWIYWSDNRVSTVHVPNQQTGTGFQFADEITPENVRDAMHCVSPEWADKRDRASVRKYKNWAEFHSSNSFNAELSQV